ncbi:hemerythrin domain-containing protein [Pseudolysinimonas kribbensis]|uniref:hemerythrin domain-containing protein n=1 Tax=Pseudolysinimonas kribbensis TaxID=433641 RepID=UPI0031DE6242
MVSLSDALTREHRDIDGGIEAFVADLDRDVVTPEPLRGAFDALRRHIYLEEEFLFPPIREAGLLMPVMVMIREHGALWQLMDALTELLDENDPADVDDELLSTCRALLDQLDQHNSKEEPIIYPHADADLDEQAAAHLVDFLESGRTPAGWVCEAAR